MLCEDEEGVRVLLDTSSLQTGIRCSPPASLLPQTIRERGNLPAGSAFLEKPFQSSSVLRAVRALLDEPGP